MRHARVWIAGLALAAALAPAAHAQGHRAVPLAADERITLDGRLDEPVWQRAPAHRTFQQQDPFTGKAAPFETRVYYATDAQALYVAVHALDPDASQIRAPFVRHDKVFRDQDFVVVYIDAIGTRASAQFFRVNARGAKGDGVHTTSNDSEDFSPDFDWDGAGRIVADGYAVEMRIPFSTLRFAHNSTATWRTMVARRMPRERTYLFLSVPLKREDQSFIAALEPLEGVAGTASEFAWTARPNITARRLTESPDDLTTKRDKVDAGIDLKVRPRADWVVDATINPDFSQVELDTPQLSRNTQFALFFQEKRPFFMEGSDLAQMPTDAVYSRSITDPRWGLRATYRGDTLAGTVLTARDTGGGLVLIPGPYATGFATQPRSHATTARIRWEAPTASGLLSVGGVALDRKYENADGSDAGFNRVAGPDVLWQFSANDRVRASWLGSQTSATLDPAQPVSETRNDSLVYVDYQRQTGRNQTYLRFRRVGEDFRNDNGFQSQASYRALNGTTNFITRREGAIHEVTPFANAARSEELATGQTVATESAVGLYLGGPRGAEAELQYRRNQLRATAVGPLHDLKQWYARLFFNPSRVVTQWNTEIEWGERVDFVDDRVRPSLVVSVTGRIRLGDRLELEPTVNRLSLDGADGTVFIETVAQLLTVTHFTSRDTLRLIVQRFDNDRRADSSSPTAASRFKTTVGSLVFAHRQSNATVFYVGVTRNRDRSVLPAAQSLATANEVFVKLQFGI